MEVNKPIRLSLARQVLNELESRIRDGRWPVGGKIPPEPELTAMFGVSRNTIREALQSLIHAGLLQARPGDGTYVTAGSRLEVIVHDQLRNMDFKRILEARLALEKEIASLAAANRTDEDLTVLQELLLRRNASGDGIDDVNFHAAVAQATGNPILSGFYDVICRYMAGQVTRKLPPESLDSEIRLHDDLLDAIRRQDCNAAGELTCRIVRFYGNRF